MMQDHSPDLGVVRCIVKGDRFQAARAAANRSIPFLFDHEARGAIATETRGDVPEQHLGRLIAWYAEPGCAPFKAGTLLSYSIRS